MRVAQRDLSPWPIISTTLLETDHIICDGYQVSHNSLSVQSLRFFQKGEWIVETVVSFSPVDHEYLHKTRQGNVILYNVETQETSQFLSNKTFVRKLEWGFHTLVYTGCVFT